MRRTIGIGVLALLAVGCHRARDAEGPMERAGKSVDRAADKTQGALQQAADRTGRAAERAVDATGKALQKAGRGLQSDRKPSPPAND